MALPLHAPTNKAFHFQSETFSFRTFTPMGPVAAPDHKTIGSASRGHPAGLEEQRICEQVSLK